MRMLVITNVDLKEEMLSNGLRENSQVIWKEKLQLSPEEKPDVVIDIDFQNDPSRIAALKQTGAGTIIINSVTDTLPETDPAFIRINAWPTLLRSSVIEAASIQRDQRLLAEEAFSCFNKSLQWLEDEPGFVTGRVISMIINEAFLALEEGVSSREDIDTAMRLGTNYPYGPFEWCERIGPSLVCTLLQRLSGKHPHYSPAALLRQSAL